MKDNLEKKVKEKEGVEIIKELLGHVRICLLMTDLSKKPISVRPMAIQKVDDLGRVYFFSGKDSNKNKHIKANSKMQLTISNDANSEYMSLYGEGEVYRDQKEIDEMYSAFANSWFDGKEDPNITIIRFTPSAVHYWDTKHGKFVQMIGLVVGAITGKQSDDGLEGDFKIK